LLTSNTTTDDGVDVNIGLQLILNSLGMINSYD